MLFLKTVGTESIPDGITGPLCDGSEVPIGGGVTVAAGWNMGQFGLRNISHIIQWNFTYQ
jgi:hypothetical protein